MSAAENHLTLSNISVCIYIYNALSIHSFRVRGSSGHRGGGEEAATEQAGRGEGRGQTTARGAED